MFTKVKQKLAKIGIAFTFAAILSASTSLKVSGETATYYYPGGHIGTHAGGQRLISGYSVSADDYPRWSKLRIIGAGLDGIYLVQDKGSGNGNIDIFYDNANEVPSEFRTRGRVGITVEVIDENAEETTAIETTTVCETETLAVVNVCETSISTIETTTAETFICTCQNGISETDLTLPDETAATNGEEMDINTRQWFAIIAIGLGQVFRFISKKLSHEN